MLKKISPIIKMRRQTEELLRLLCRVAEERQAQDIACRLMADIQRRISLASAEIMKYKSSSSK